MLTPTVPAEISRTYFLELTLTRGAARTVSRNVYWLSTKPDAVDWSKTLGAGQRRGLPARRLRRPHRPAEPAGRDREGDGVDPAPRRRRGHDRHIRGTRDRADPGVFTRADVRRGTRDGRRPAATTRCCRSAGATTT